MTIESQTRRPSLSERLVGGPVGFRRLLERMGPIYIKIGQFLALRPDLVPQAYCDELMRLLDRVQPFPWEQAREILHSDLARDPLETFASVDPEPVAAGSLAQVHKGRLHDGTVVAIKIQRPRIRERVQQDLANARRLARVLRYSGITFVTSPEALVEELRQWMLEELDIERELANVSRLRDLAKNSPLEFIPTPYSHLSSRRILVTTYVEGLRLSEILAEIRSREDRRSPQAEAYALDVRKLAEHLFEATLRQMFKYQFFHADLHPGNLFAVSGNRIGYVDFGLCAELDPSIRDKQLRYFEAVYSGRTEQIVKSLSEVLVPAEDSDIEGFRRDAATLTDEWVRERNTELYRSATGSRGRSATGQWLVDLMHQARAYRMEIPPRTLALYRALLTAESVANELAVINFPDVTRRFFESLNTEEAFTNLEPDNLRPILLNMFSLWRDSPMRIHEALSDLAEGRLRINAAVVESAKTSRQRSQRTRLLAASIVSVGLAILLAIPDLPTLRGYPARNLIVALLILDYAYLLWNWRLKDRRRS